MALIIKSGLQSHIDERKILFEQLLRSTNTCGAHIGPGRRSFRFPEKPHEVELADARLLSHSVQVDVVTGMRLYEPFGQFDRLVNLKAGFQTVSPNSALWKGGAEAARCVRDP